MQKVAFYLIYPIIWVLSILPMRVLYMLSDVLFLTNYYIIGYRKSVVLSNLKMSFPEKNEAELLKIRKRFFRYLSDFFVESLKSFTITEKEIRKRLRYKNIEVTQKIADNKQDIMLVGAHQGNWEWMVGIPLHLKRINSHAAYNRIKNPHFDAIVKKSRSRFGAVMYRTSDTIKNMVSNYKNNILGLYCLASDQSPRPEKTHYWREFMGVKVPVHTGAEMLAKKLNMAFVFWTSRRVKRGVYEVEFEVITETPKEFKNYELTDAFIQKVERNIRNYPDIYLWSHKRFKHKDKVPPQFL